MFDEAKADRAIKFIRALSHTKGDWAGKPFQLMDWEKKIIRDLFGTVNEDGTRQYREAYISTGRKNGKTEIAACLANYCLYADNENTPEVYTNAGDREQASLVFNAAAAMVDMAPTLKKRSKVLHSVKRIVNHNNNGFLRALSHEGFTKHGFHVSCSINDEVHIWPNRELYDVMKTGTGARRQPLIINITTAGWDKASFCADLYKYAKQIQQDPSKDPTFYTAIFELDEGDDWKDEANWHKANPSLGRTITIEFLRGEFQRAMENPAFENSFKRLYLNMWTSQETRWLALDIWDACGGTIDLELLKGRTCYGGVDLATTTDIAAYVLVFPPEDNEAYILVPFFFVPEDTVEKRSKKDNRPYNLWAKHGYIIPTPGNVIDYNFIKAKMRETAQLYNLPEVAYDRWGATALVTDMTEEGLTMVPVAMGFASMSAPTKEMEKLILSRKINHGNNPVLRQMFDDVMMVSDAAGNIKPDKAKSKDKIDGIVASIIALDRALRNTNGKSVYETSGIKTVIPKEETKEEPKQEIEIDEQRQAIVRRCIRCGSIEAELDYCRNCGARIWDNLQSSNRI